MAKEQKKEEKTEDKVANALTTLKKKYGADVLMQIGKEIDFKVDWISTGCFSLDEVMGKGIPRGRIIEVFGAESSGKSTLALFIMSQIQARGGRVALIDAENAFDGSYASNIGLDVSKLLVSQPGTLEESMDIIKELVETEAMDIIVVDSVSALVPKSEIEGDDFMKDTMAIQARLMSRALRILSGPISKSKTVVIFVNQVRDKVGVFFGAKTTTSGGRALKFFSSVRLDIAKGKKIEKNDIQIGNEIIVTCAKNKVGFPWKKTKLDLYYAKGIDLAADALDFGEKVGVIEKEGMTYGFKNKKLGIGREKARTALEDNKELFDEVKKAIINQINLKKDGNNTTKKED
jgi:recombination protein RecA